MSKQTAAALLDRCLLRAWRLVERVTYGRIRDQWPDEWRESQRRCDSKGDFLHEAYDKLVGP